MTGKDAKMSIPERLTAKMEEACSTLWHDVSPSNVLAIQVCSNGNMGRWLWDQLGSEEGKKAFVLEPWYQSVLNDVSLFW